MTQIDTEALNKMTGGDDEMLADVAVMFVRLLPEIKARTEYGIVNHEASEVENAAHQLRSRVGYFGATSLQAVVGQLELAARQNEIEKTQQLSQQVFEGVDQLLDELRSLTQLALEVDNE